MHKTNGGVTAMPDLRDAIDLDLDLPRLFTLALSGAGGGFQVLKAIPAGPVSLQGVGNILDVGNLGHVVSGDGDLATITGGNGDNRIKLSGALNTIVLGDGSNVIDVSDGRASVAIGPSGLTLSLRKLTLSLEAIGPTRSGFDLATLAYGETSANVGFGNGGSGNIGIFNGLWNSGPGNGTGNIGAFNGLWNGGSGNGNFNIGVLNGNLNGVGNLGSGNGANNGNSNTGFLNGNLNGNFNIGNNNGDLNGNGNFGALNGNLNGNRNVGDNNGSNNGNQNIGSVNGNQNGNGTGAALAGPGPGTHGSGLTFQGAMNTIVLGNGNNKVDAGSGLCTVVAGNGNNQIVIDGRYDTVLAGHGRNYVSGSVSFATVSLGDGGDSVRLDGDHNRVTTGSGDDVIWLSGRHNVIDAGSGMNFIMGGDGNDTFVLNRAGHGQDRIAGFSLSGDDVLDLHATLSSAGWDGTVGNLGLVLNVVMSGHDTLLAVRTSPGAAFAQVADLVDVRTSMPDLLRHGCLLL